MSRQVPKVPTQQVPKLAIAVVTTGLVAVAAVEGLLVLRAIAGGWYGPAGLDFDTYMVYTRSWLDGSGFYPPNQLNGTYVVEDAVGNVYPPILLYLTVPFASGLPAALWWAIPGAIVLVTLRTARPAWWAWPLLAFVMCYPRTWTVLALGNPAMWSIAFGGAGVLWGWPAIGAAFKLTFAPLVLVGAKHASWKWGALAGAAASVPFGAMWLEYATALANAHSVRGLGYIVGEWPIALALVAVVASGRARRQSEGSLAEEVRLK